LTTEPNKQAKTGGTGDSSWFPPPPIKRPRYGLKRRKWKRVPIEQRRATAAALSDLARRREVSWLLVVLLIVSLGVHAATMPFVKLGRDVDMESLAGREDSYFRKVLEKAKAGKVAKALAGRVTMPPPPEDPEKVMADALSTTVTSDVAKVTKDLLPVELQEDLAAHIKASLADEIAAAAEAATKGELSPEELAALQEQFRRKAHTEAVKWRQEYRKEHQVEIAKVSTTDWYEKYVSIPLVNNIKWNLFGNKLVNPYWHPNLWWHTYNGEYTGWSKYPCWGDMRSNGYLAGKIGQLNRLASDPAAVLRDPEGRTGIKGLKARPGPGKEQAEAILKRLRFIHKGHHPGTYPSPSWRNVIYGDVDEHKRPNGKVLYARMCDGIIEEYYPHREDQVRPIAKRLDELWEKTLADARIYRDMAASGAGVEKVKAARDACLKSIGAIPKEAKKLLVPDARAGWPRGPHRVINAVVRSQVLRSPLREKRYEYWVDSLVGALEILVRQMVENEFQKGIIVAKEGIEQIRKEFAEEIAPRLRRDVKAALPKKEWDKRIFDTSYPYLSYRSKVTGQPRKWPDAADVKREEARLAEVLSKRPELAAYAEKRRQRNIRYFTEAVENMKEVLLSRILEGQILMRSWREFAEGVDYADKVKERLDARKAAKDGRGQDLATLTTEGVPDTSAAHVALLTGAVRGHGANLEPAKAMMQARYYTFARPETAVQTSAPMFAPRPAEWGFVTQVDVKARFKGKTPRFEAIPFLNKFPRLDGDLSDWGTVRPLVLRPRHLEDKEPLLVYAAWNYQGFFFAYRVRQQKEEFHWAQKSPYPNVIGWPYGGDYLQLMFDTLDARNTNRGEPHAQEFIILPRGTELDENSPGAERVIASQRDAKVKEYRRIKSSLKVFVQQPAREVGPDGTGPYRITKTTDEGYTVEVFIPRTLFKVPVFAPGWYVGFECAVGIGRQRRHWTGYRGYAWAGGGGGPGAGDKPNRWGDLLLLGTDPAVFAQDADAAGSLTRSVIPGHSYLLTVVDPDRNVNVKTKDAVIVSAEVMGESNDVEVFVLEETAENSGVFRGYIDTQPGVGREVQGVLEVAPRDVIRFGYVDFADAQGRRNVVVTVKMPVGSPLYRVTGARMAGR